MLAPHVLNAVSAARSEAQARLYLHEALQARLCINRTLGEALVSWHAERHLVSSFLTLWRVWYSTHDARVHLLTPMEQLYPVYASARKHGYDLTGVEFLNQTFTLLSSPPGALTAHWPSEWAGEQARLTPSPWPAAPLHALLRGLPDASPDTLRHHLNAHELDGRAALMKYFRNLHHPDGPLPGFDHLEVWEHQERVLVYLALHPGADMPLTEVADGFGQHAFCSLLEAQEWQVQTSPRSALPNTFSALLISPPHFKDSWNWHER